MNRILQKLCGVENKRENQLLDLLDEDLKNTLLLALEGLGTERGLKLAGLGESHGETLEGLKKRFESELGVHEVMDRSFLMAENIEAYLMEHPAVALDSKMYQLATLANLLLNELYQVAGRKAG